MMHKLYAHPSLLKGRVGSINTLPLLGSCVTLLAHSCKETQVFQLRVHLHGSLCLVNPQASEKAPHESVHTGTPQVWVPACRSPTAAPPAAEQGHGADREAALTGQGGGVTPGGRLMAASNLVLTVSCCCLQISAFCYEFPCFFCNFFPTILPSLLQIPIEVPWFLFNPADAGCPL